MTLGQHYYKQTDIDQAIVQVVQQKHADKPAEKSEGKLI